MEIWFPLFFVCLCFLSVWEASGVRNNDAGREDPDAELQNQKGLLQNTKAQGRPKDAAELDIQIPKTRLWKNKARQYYGMEAKTRLWLNYGYEAKTLLGNNVTWSWKVRWSEEFAMTDGNLENNWLERS